VTATDEGAVIHLAGVLDMSTVATLREAVRAELPRSLGRIILDLSN
jgi:anti-anti-sigma regulatory factor